MGMSPRRSVLLPLILSAGLLAGCGTDLTHAAGSSRAKPAAAAGSAGAQVAVIEGWANALRRGDVRAAAGFFAVPSIFANGAGANGQLAEVVVRSLRQAQVVNASLSCGAQLVSTRRSGKYILGAFRLTNRSGLGAGCGSGAGQTASVEFLIRNGHIVEWIRAAAGSGAPPKLPAPTANPQTPGTQI
jgi:hypothetical protein